MLSEKVKGIASELKQYAETRMEIIELKLVSRVADVSARSVSAGIVLVLGFFFLLFLSLAFLFSLEEVTGSMTISCLILSGIYGVIIFIYFLVRPKAEQKVKDKIIQKLLRDGED